MKTLLHEMKTAALATLGLVVLVCGIYPLLVWGLAEALFPRQANGSLIVGAHGQVVGSRLLAQPFASERYFHPRPSAAGQGYDAANSGGSNLGPLSQRLDSLVRSRVARYREVEPACTRSPGSGGRRDRIGQRPGPAYQRGQCPPASARIALARRLDEAQVQRLIQKYTARPQLGILGEAGVNVLELNLALDRIP